MAEESHTQLPFTEQVAFFRRKVNLPTEAWTQLWQQGHDHAFVVAGANRDELVADFRAAVDKAISQGTTLDEFRQDFAGIVKRHGWSYNGSPGWRSKVIYDTNMRTSYAAGRYAQLQAVKQDRPYWEFVHTPVAHPRQQHVAWDGLVLHADDPWWQAHYPPDGWGCQCVVNSLSDNDLGRRGKSGPDTAPAVHYHKVTVGKHGPAMRTVRVPEGVDPGFAYAPGASAWRQAASEEAAAVGRVPPSQWQDLLGGDWKSAGRPEHLPTTSAPPPLQAASETKPAELTRDALGADEALYQPGGAPVMVDAETLAKQTLARDREDLPLLVQTLKAPEEVWVSIVRKGDYYRTRIRAIKAFNRDGRTIYVIAQAGNAALERWRTSEDIDQVQRARQGKLLAHHSQD